MAESRAMNSERLVARFLTAVEAHKAHPPGLRLDWDGIHRCPACDPVPPRMVQVRGVLPGCWEVWCRRCARAGHLVAQVSSWERAMRRAGEHLAGGHSPVGQQLSSIDPCPPDGTVVRDDCGQEWVNSGCYPGAWMPAEDDGDSETWTKVAGNYGPVTILEWGDEER